MNGVKGLRQARGGINSGAVYAHHSLLPLDARGRQPCWDGGQGLGAKRKDAGGVAIDLGCNKAEPTEGLTTVHPFLAVGSVRPDNEGYQLIVGEDMRTGEQPAARLVEKRNTPLQNQLTLQSLTCIIPQSQRSRVRANSVIRRELELR